MAVQTHGDLFGKASNQIFIHTSILNAYASAGALKWAQAVHSDARKAGLEFDLRVGNVLVHMCAKCGCIDAASLIFNRIKTRDVTTWNTMVGARAIRGCGVEAYRLFLQREGFKPDYMSILNACASAEALEWAKAARGLALKAGLEPDLRVASALVHMYAKGCSISGAQLVFDRSNTRYVTTWNIMIGAYAENGCGSETYRLFLQMKREGFKPDFHLSVFLF